ncbi:hypothetical protein BH09ACT1_BH09ACT1_23170 [soil metagenome]
MRYSDDPIPPRRSDADLLGGFGYPVFELVAQPRLQPIGWGEMGINGEAVEVSVSYWLADVDGDFHFTRWPMGDVGTALRGSVFTEVIRQPLGLSATPEREALTSHLNYLVSNDRINQPEFALELGSEEGQAALTEWYEDIEVLVARPDTVLIDGTAHRAESIAYGGYRSRVARVADRLVTLVIHDDDAAAIDIRLVTRAGR